MSGRENKTLNGQKRQNWTHLKQFQKGVKKRHDRHLSKLPHRQPPLNTTPLNPPVSIEETLSWLQVPLWYMLLLTFPRSYGVIIRVLGCSLAGSAQRLYCNSFPPLSSHPFCNDTYNLMFSRKGGLVLGWHTHTHTAIQQCSLQALCTRQTWVMWQPRRETAPGWIFLFLLFYY